MSEEEKLIAILKIVNQSPYGWLDIDSNEAEEIRKIIKPKEDEQEVST
tara:strand:+ start:41 stop:184 length:144 start_codon:yes stop_codon:yes gene_type:complete